jgi:tRNA(fMet)-specific endonuclease VapC
VIYLLDTNIVLALLRDNTLGRHILLTYPDLGVIDQAVISVVTLGEIRLLARQFGWGASRLQTLEAFLTTQVVALDIHRDDVIAAYVEADWIGINQHGGAVNLGKNDLWIAATTHVNQAVLLTTDRDFDHLHGHFLQRDYIDPAAGAPPPP